MIKFIGLVAGLSLVAMTGAAMAQDNVAGTPHDLTDVTNNVYQTTTAQICVFCHTPHAASTTAEPLWNREDSVATYTMYSSATIDMTMAASPQGVSLACLSCHDGTVALDAFQNAPGPGGGVAGSEGYAFTGADTGNMFPAASFAMLSPDLSDDHPISITYDNTVDTAFNAAVSGSIGSLPLYGVSSNQVECGTCHNPHNNTNTLFLRISNAGSALCKTCHIK